MIKILEKIIITGKGNNEKDPSFWMVHYPNILETISFHNEERS